MDRDDIKIEFSEADPETNRRSATIQIISRNPGDIDPEFARPMFYNAVWVGASKIEEESK
jgi:hypothetical protein